MDALFAELDSSLAFSREVMQPSTVEWDEVERSARERGMGDCPVCLGPLASCKEVSLLSCSHVFHERCILSFERFSLTPLPNCPVCRAGYTKRSILLRAPSCEECEPPEQLSEGGGGRAVASGKGREGGGGRVVARGRGRGRGLVAQPVQAISTRSKPPRR